MQIHKRKDLRKAAVYQDETHKNSCKWSLPEKGDHGVLCGRGVLQAPRTQTETHAEDKKLDQHTSRDNWSTGTKQINREGRVKFFAWTFRYKS